MGRDLSDELVRRVGHGLRPNVGEQHKHGVVMKQPNGVGLGNTVLSHLQNSVPQFEHDEAMGGILQQMRHRRRQPVSPRLGEGDEQDIVVAHHHVLAGCPYSSCVRGSNHPLMMGVGTTTFRRASGGGDVALCIDGGGVDVVVGGCSGGLCCCRRLEILVCGWRDKEGLLCHQQ